MQITIKETDKERFLKKVNKIADAFEAKGKEIKIDEIDHGKEKIQRGSDWSAKLGYKWTEIEVPTITYEITGDLESKGYYIVGLVEQQSDSVVVDTLVKEVEGHKITIPRRFYDMSKIECDECHQNRRRNTGEIVYNPVEDNYLCIGTGCINDFMGFPVDLINNLFALKKTETDNSRPKVSYGSLQDNWFYKPEEVFAVYNALKKLHIRGAVFITSKVLSDINYLMINNFPLTEEYLKKTYLRKDTVKVIDYICSNDTDMDFEKFCIWLTEEKGKPWTRMSCLYSSNGDYEEVIRDAENCLLSEKITFNAIRKLTAAIETFLNFNEVLKDYDRYLESEKRDAERREKEQKRNEEFKNLEKGKVITITGSTDDVHFSSSNRPSSLKSANGFEYKWWPNQNNKIQSALKINGDTFEIDAQIVSIQDDRWGKAAFILPEDKEVISKSSSSNKEYIKLERGEDIAIDIKSSTLTNTHGRSYTIVFEDPNGRKYSYNFNTTYAPKGFKDDVKKATKVVGTVAADRGEFVSLNGYAPLKIIDKLEESSNWSEHRDSIKDERIENKTLIYDSETGILYDIDGFINLLRYMAEFNDNAQWKETYEHYKDCQTIDELWIERNGEHDFGQSCKIFKFEDDVNSIISHNDGLELIDINESDTNIEIKFKYSGEKDIKTEVCDNVVYWSDLKQSDYFQVFSDDDIITYKFDKTSGFNYF